eukprot:775870-Rhodomonas_salina.2
MGAAPPETGAGTWRGRGVSQGRAARSCARPAVGARVGHAQDAGRYLRQTPARPDMGQPAKSVLGSA